MSKIHFAYIKPNIYNKKVFNSKVLDGHFVIIARILSLIIDNYVLSYLYLERLCCGHGCRL